MSDWTTSFAELPDCFMSFSDEEEEHLDPAELGEKIREREQVSIF